MFLVSLYVRLRGIVRLVLANIADCPHTPCLGVVVIACHPEDKKRFDNKTRIWTFICTECGKEFSAGLNQIHTEEITEGDERYPNRRKPAFS